MDISTFYPDAPGDRATLVGAESSFDFAARKLAEEQAENDRCPRRAWRVRRKGPNPGGKLYTPGSDYSS